MFPRAHRFRSLLALVLATVLVIAQHVAFAHGVTHLAAVASGDDPALPHAKMCDQCNQASNLGLGLPTPAVIVFAAPCFRVPPLQHDSVYQPRAVSPFSSRAPPAFL